MTITKARLADFGFATVADFQRCTLFPGGDGKPLALDGAWGPNTAHAAGLLPKVSSHFDVDADHLRSRGNHQCKVRRELLAELEELRRQLGHPLPILDAYRDPAYNATLTQHGPDDGLQHGAATNSQHLYGLAADIPDSARVPFTYVEGLRIFSGIGYKRSTGHVVHVDVRHVDPTTNTTHSSVHNPAVWQYA